MTWVMPGQLLPFAGLLTLVFAWPRISKPSSHVRLFVDVLIIGVGTKGRCRVGLIVSRGGRESHDVWLEVSTGLVKLVRQTDA